MYYCVEYGGAIYGCSRKLEQALAALERGKRRGVTAAKIVERRARPNKQPAGWLVPFA